MRRGDAEIACVDREAEAQIGVDRVEPPILQRIGAQLVDQADAAPFLAQIEQYAPCRFPAISCERGVELRAAIAFERSRARRRSGIRCAAGRAGGRAVRRADDQGDMLGRILGRAKGDDLGILRRRRRAGARARGDEQAGRIGVGRRASAIGIATAASSGAIRTDEEGRQQPGEPRQLQSRSAPHRACAERDGAERPFSGLSEIPRRIGERHRGGRRSIQRACAPRAPADRATGGVALVGELERRRARGADQQIAPAPPDRRPRDRSASAVSIASTRIAPARPHHGDPAWPRLTRVDRASGRRARSLKTRTRSRAAHGRTGAPSRGTRSCTLWRDGAARDGRARPHMIEPAPAIGLAAQSVAR